MTSISPLSLARGLLHRTAPPFQNRHPHGRPTLTDLLRWHRRRRQLGLPMPPGKDLSPAQPDLNLIHGVHSDGNVTWIGHSTLLVQMGKRNILTDPHFSLHASPIPGLGPKRWQAPGITAHDLPDIDVVLISHNHYDHLDRASVQFLAERNNKILFLAPLGLDSWFASNAPHAKVRTMGWDESVQMDELEIVFVAVQHWSGRGLADTNRSLWGGFALRTPQSRFFFAGDLGYSADCKEIGLRYGPFDLAAIPIGAYEPRWFMCNQHVNPDEAVRVHRDIRARRSLGIHWGTFNGISDEPLDQPPRDLALALKTAEISEEEIFVVRHGESIPIVRGNST